MALKPKSQVSLEPTPYALRCQCVHGKLIFLTEEEYTRQMEKPDNLWTCPYCGDAAVWDDANFDRYLEG